MSETERERIAAAYAKRAGLDHRYDPRRFEEVMANASRASAWGRFLLERGHDLGTTVEIGAGTGGIMAWALSLGAAPAMGLDVLRDRASAMHTSVPGAQPVVADGRAIPVRTGGADTVVCATLFSSVLDDVVAGRIAAEVERVLRPGGLLLFYDLLRRNPRNPDVRPVGPSSLRGMFPSWELRCQKVTLAPPIARALSSHANLSRLAECFAPLRTHVAAALVRP